MQKVTPNPFQHRIFLLILQPQTSKTTSMDILPLHIEYLLTRHDCVIVPGLGAFIVSESEAYIDLERGFIRPRRREISFNSSVVTDDGLLSHSIARREGLSYEDARRMLSNLAEKMTKDLNEEGEASLGMTGRLVKDAEGLITFQPRRSAITSDIMQEVELHSKAAEKTVETELPTITSIGEGAEEDGIRTIRVKSDRYVFTISKRAVHAAAMIIAILTVGISLLMPINHDNEEKASVISIEDFFHHTVRTEALKADSKIALETEKNDSIANIDIKPSL